MAKMSISPPQPMELLDPLTSPKEKKSSSKVLTSLLDREIGQELVETGGYRPDGSKWHGALTRRVRLRVGPHVFDVEGLRWERELGADLLDSFVQR